MSIIHEICLTATTPFERALEFAAQMKAGNIIFNGNRTEHMRAINSCLPIAADSIVSIAGDSQGLVVTGWKDGRLFCAWARQEPAPNGAYGHQFLPMGEKAKIPLCEKLNKLAGKLLGRQQG